MINEQTLKDRLQILAREKNIHFNACWKQLHGLGDKIKDFNLPQDILDLIKEINKYIAPVISEGIPNKHD